MRRRIYEISALIILAVIVLLSSLQATADPVTDASVVVTAMPAYTTGGSGGDYGGESGPTVDTPPPGTVWLDGIINHEGVFMENIAIKSEDGRGRLFIFAGTVGLINETTVPREISIIEIDESPCSLPVGVDIIGRIYKIGPSGLAFSETVSLTLYYEDSWIPEDIEEGWLYIAVCEGLGDGWKRIPNSRVDIITNKVTATIDHFSAFAIFAEYIELPLQISQLSISPVEVTGDEVVSIGFIATNTNTFRVTQTLGLMINGQVEAEQTVTLDAGESKKVTFNVTRHHQGTYIVTVGTLAGTFMVGSVLPEEPAGTTLPEQPSQPTVEEPSSEATSDELPVVEEPSAQEISVAWYIVPIIVVLAAAGVSWYYLRRKWYRNMADTDGNEET